MLIKEILLLICRLYEASQLHNFFQKGFNHPILVCAGFLNPWRLDMPLFRIETKHECGHGFGLCCNCASLCLKETYKDKQKIYTRWFKVTFSSPSWRSLNHLKGSLNHRKKVTKNCQVDMFVYPEELVVWERTVFFSNSSGMGPGPHEIPKILKGFLLGNSQGNSQLGQVKCTNSTVFWRNK